ncbi:N-acetylmuramoyl-L-alanine amidase [Paenibacillus antri]|uniref:N-acetylmuramoyl-L-alanine amidase n=1 Tax=Paenibacillus antri TaxID=2582848 RepID=A0A5R9FZT9_9BACL|nr:N-acetylmuramoyl-L-alanine amidase [Paenibacillus antri]TLS48269.1 N-acetylmuramoyl-L-alanine amidase [Paenibacillus antri]
MAVPILIIDPGHGGNDPGGGSNSLWLEKHLVLQISLYQAERFGELGVPVTLTRRTDTTLAASDRAEIVRESGARYCISNHINAGGGDGVEAIHSIHSDGALARRIVDAISTRGQNVRRVFTRTLPGDRTRDYYFMHRETGGVQTVIVEYGFADSPGDDITQLQTQWKSYAEAVVMAFCRHIGHPYAPPRAVSSGSTGGASGRQPEVQAAIGVVVNGAARGSGYLIDNVSYVPARLLTELFGATVGWDGSNVTIRTDNDE